MTSSTKPTEVTNLLSVLHFTARILFPRHHHALFPIFSALYIAYKNQKMRNISLSLLPVPGNLLLELCPRHISDIFGDLDDCIFISNNIMGLLGARNGQWVKITKSSSSVEVAKRDTSNENYELDPERNTVLMQVIGLPNLDCSKSLVNNVNYDNLKNRLKLDESDYSYIKIEKLHTAGKDSAEFVPNVATRTSVKIIKRTPDIDNAVLDTVLKKYFQSPRYLCQGNLFCIHVARHAPEVHYLPTGNGVDKLFFIVEEINGKPYDSEVFKRVKTGYLVVNSFTALTHAGSQQRFLPPICFQLAGDKRNLTASNYESYMSNLCPNGLQKYCDELEASFWPFLRHPKKINVRPLFLLYGQRGSGKKEIISALAQKLGLGIWNVDCLDIQSNSAASTEGKLKFAFSKVKQYAPCLMVMNNIESLAKNKNEDDDIRTVNAFHEEVANLYSNLGDWPVLLVAKTHCKNETHTSIPASLARAFLFTLRISSPNESERLSLLEWLLKSSGLHIHPDVSLPHYAANTSGFVFADLAALISHAARNKYWYLKKIEKLENDAEVLRPDDFEVALDIMHSTYADAIGAPKIPAVSWDDVGGLSDLKEEILRTVVMPLKYPELVASGLRRSGILFYGPPGTGKTLLAKAVATECSLNFLSVKGPELLNMYVGQSEENVREVFERARSAAPCIIFFDELDSLAPNRGRSGDSGGVMDRVVSQLLSEMDGIQKSKHVFVIGATNRPDLIDPALLRPGRFDKLLYVGMCEDDDSKINVLKALTRKFKLKPDVDFTKIAELFPKNVTGADMYSVCSKAWLSAVRRIIHSAEDAPPDVRSSLLSSTVEVSAEDFFSAVADLKPSVSDQDLDYYRRIRKEMSVSQ